MSVPVVTGFLDGVSLLSPAERMAFASTGADSPAALWAMMDSSPEPFVRLLGGKDRANQLRKVLWQCIPENERTILLDKSFQPPPPGVPLNDDPGELPAPHLNLELRDRLHKELQR